MANTKFKIKKGLKLDPQTTGANAQKGDIEVLDSDSKLHYHDGTSDRTLVDQNSAETLTNKTLDADNNTVTNIDNNEIKAAAGIELSKLELLTANRAAATDGTGELVASSVTDTELGYVSGVTSSIQTQINSKEPTVTKGDLTEATSTVLTITGGTASVIGAGTSIEVDQATTSTDGYLSSTDWNTFNSKQASGSYITDLTGDVTASGPGSAAATVAANAVTNAKLAQVATSTIKGRTTAGTGNVEDLTTTQATALLDQFTTSLQGVVPGSGGGTSNFLRADGSWAAPAGGGGGSGLGAGGTQSVTGNYTIVSGDAAKVLNVDSSVGSITLTLPTPTAGFLITIKDAQGSASTNPISVVRSGTETIDNAPANDLISASFESKTYISNGTNWYRIAIFDGGPIAGRAVIAGGTNGSDSNVIDYVNIVTNGNATDFGDLTLARDGTAGVSSSTRGAFAGSLTPNNNIDYITIATTGNATDFGDLTVSRGALSGMSNQTRGCFAGGRDGSADYNTIDYITIASTGNATDFGDLSTTRSFGSSGGPSSSTRGTWSIGITLGATQLNVIEYITLATTGNSTNFGNLTSARGGPAGVSSGVRGLFAGGNIATSSNIIDYITIATAGNATDFGDLTVSRSYPTGTGSSIKAIISGGGVPASPYSNVIDTVDIATLANATDFGDLTVARRRSSAVSNAHGGLV